MTGRSPSGRAGRASHEARSGLHHAATIPNAQDACRCAARQPSHCKCGAWVFVDDFPDADRWPVEPTQWGDDVAAQMRDYYEANKPLRWWQRRRVWTNGNADSLMIGLLNIAASAIEARRAATGNTDSVHEHAVPNGETPQ